MNATEVRSLVARVQDLENPSLDEMYEAFAKTPHSSPQEQCGIFNPTFGQVYFAHFLKTGRLKIGFSTILRKRLRTLELAAGEPFNLLTTIAGNRALELRCLMAFAGWRLSGEWFLFTPECAAFFEEFISKFSQKSKEEAA